MDNCRLCLVIWPQISPSAWQYFSCLNKPYQYSSSQINSRSPSHWYGKPYALTRAYFAPDLSESAARIVAADGRTTVQAIERLSSVRARSALQTISATVADARLARLLGIAAGRAVLTAQPTYYSDRPTPIEVVLATFHPTRYSVTIELVGADSAIDMRPKPKRNEPDGWSRGTKLLPGGQRPRKSAAPLAPARKVW